MNKGELVNSISEKAEVSKAVVEKVLQAFDESVIEGLAKDGRVRIGTLGFMSATYRAPRTGRNPKNPEETYSNPETAAATFKQSELLKVAMKQPEVIEMVKAKKKA